MYFPLTYPTILNYPTITLEQPVFLNLLVKLNAYFNGKDTKKKSMNRIAQPFQDPV